MHKRGFTLVELLVVVAIIGILASIITVSLTGSKAKARDARRVADTKNLQLALSLYYNDNLQYPDTLQALLTGGYLTSLPRDPNSSTACTTGAEASCYKYAAYRSGGTGVSGACLSTASRVTYHLGAVLEDKSNSALIDDADSGLGTSPFNGYTACPGGTVFEGTSVDCGSTAGTGQPSGTELCYDVRP